MPSEALRIFAQGMFECGITEAEIDLMIRRNPACLLGLNPDDFQPRKTS
jgi:hypothetical protein